MNSTISKPISKPNNTMIFIIIGTILLFISIGIGAYFYISSNTTTTKSTQKSQTITESQTTISPQQTTISPPQTTLPPIYKSYINTDFSGQGDIQSANGDVTTCQNICNSLTNCNGFATDGTTCSFKNINGSNKSGFNPSITYYYKSGGEGNGQAIVPNCTNIEGNYFNVGNKLNPDNSLYTCQSLSNGNYKLIMQSDGNLIIYNTKTTGAVWQSNGKYKGTGNLPYYFKLQKDGKLILFDSTNAPLLQLNTTVSPNSTLYMQEDGNMVLYDSSNNALFETNTSGK